MKTNKRTKKRGKENKYVDVEQKYYEKGDDDDEGGEEKKKRKDH